MSQNDDAERRFVRAREMIGRGKQALAEGHRLMRQLSGEVRAARARGAINQAIWECERASGRRAGFFSQSGQDAFLDERVFEGKRGGVYVEIGGFDGLTASNCLFFELMRGWSGVMVEPSSRARARAAEFRRCPCLPLAVAGHAGEAEFVEIEEGLRQMSGLADTYAPEILARVEADPRHRARRRPVRTRSLAQVLDSQYLSEVDYVSIDVCGAELAILAEFPFERYKVRAFTVDVTTRAAEIRALMERRGYARIEAFGTDDVFLRRGA